MPLTTGAWYINIDGVEDVLEIDNVHTGVVSAKLHGATAEGLWDEAQQKLTLAPQWGAPQLLTGYLLTDSLGLGPYLAGTVERFVATGGAAGSPTCGFFACAPSKWKSIGPVTIDVKSGACCGRVDWIDFAESYDGQGKPACYLATPFGGVWRSTDFDQPSPTWEPLTDSFPSVPSTERQGLLTVSTVLVDAHAAGTGKPCHVYAGNRGSKGLLRSTDSGDTWHLVAPTSFAGRTVSRLLLDSQGTIYVATDVGANQAGGLFSSTDGTTFTLISDSSHTGGVDFSGANFTDVVYVTDATGAVTLYVAVVGAGPNTGIWSVSQGTWTQMPLPLISDSGGSFTLKGITRTTLAADPNRGTPGGAYAAVSGGTLINLFKLDSTGTWASSGAELRQEQQAIAPNEIPLWTNHGYMQPIAVSSAPPYAVYFGHFVHLWQSVDGGATWNDLISAQQTLRPHTDQHVIALRGADVYLGGDGGLFRLRAGAWETLNTPSPPR
jgi:hypothetical protein